MKSFDFIMAVRSLLPPGKEMDEWVKRMTFELDGVRIACVNAGKADNAEVERLKRRNNRLRIALLNIVEGCDRGAAMNPADIASSALAFEREELEREEIKAQAASGEDR